MKLLYSNTMEVYVFENANTKQLQLETKWTIEHFRTNEGYMPNWFGDGNPELWKISGTLEIPEMYGWKIIHRKFETPEQLMKELEKYGGEPKKKLDILKLKEKIPLLYGVK